MTKTKSHHHYPEWGITINGMHPDDVKQFKKKAKKEFGSINKAIKYLIIKFLEGDTGNESK